MARAGADLEVIDQKTGKDLTAYTLALAPAEKLMETPDEAVKQKLLEIIRSNPESLPQ